ncbi:hypothetical protein GT348_07160 [Aristophania vespae]|uniref:Uncharacterized protein n=1 Tax=Aristophania vespae TaxID=2697033 RepID=A0A6P1NMH1_9PROT|nr:hypothetical protein [Aristophania vespae]QHI96041.1 hypothetical protein GT348_07160 [Aristophania vespae]
MNVAEKKVKEIKKIINARTVHFVDIKEMQFNAKRDHDESHAGVGWSEKYKLRVLFLLEFIKPPHIGGFFYFGSISKSLFLIRR